MPAICPLFVRLLIVGKSTKGGERWPLSIFLGNDILVKLAFMDAAKEKGESNPYVKGVSLGNQVQ